MPTHAREALLDQLVRNLRVIGTTGAYSATVCPTVTRTVHPLKALPQHPFIMVGASEEDYVHDSQIGAAGTYSRTMHCTVQYAFMSPDMDQDASRAIHDVEYALRDWTVTATATSLSIQRVEVGIGSLSEPEVVVTFEIDILYRTDDNAPATRV